MAIDKITLYNNALQMLGERRLTSASENTETRYRLDTVWDLGAVSFCLDLVKPHWATKVVELSGGSAGSQHGYTNVHDLPDDYINMVGLFSDENLDQKVTRYFIQGRTVASDYESVYLRYVSNDHVEDFTEWTPNFARVLTHYLASQLAPAIRPSSAEAFQSQFADHIETATQLEGMKEPPERSPKSTNEVDAVWLRLYNDAMQIMGLPQMINAGDDSQARSALDVALNNYLVENMMEEINWHFPSVVVKITRNPSIEPDWGFRYAFDKPDDMIRLKGIFQEEYQQVPLKYYDEDENHWYAEVHEIWVDYINDEMLSSPLSWPASFRKLISAAMARAAAPGIPNANVENAEFIYKERMNRAKSIDANQSPPQMINQGSWVTAKTNLFRRSRGFLGRP